MVIRVLITIICINTAAVLFNTMAVSFIPTLGKFTPTLGKFTIMPGNSSFVPLRTGHKRHPGRFIAIVVSIAEMRARLAAWFNTRGKRS